MQIGGIGHMFYDLLTIYIIATKCKNVTFVYPELISLNDDYHRNTTNTKKESKFKKINWDDFLKFDTDEQLLTDLNTNNLQTKHVKLCQPFKSFNINKIIKLIKSHDNTLFVLEDNNRIYLNEIYHTHTNLYNKIIKKTKNKFKHLHKPNDILTIAIHIRRGDWNWQPLDYNINILTLLYSILNKHNVKYNINIYAVGTNEQLKEIKQKVKGNNIKYFFNTDVFDTLTDLYNSHIVFGGHSNFPKFITTFSDNLFVYLPYKDGIIPALGVNNTFKNYHLGKYPEIYDVERRIPTDIYCKKNINIIINKINEIVSTHK